MTMNFAIHMLVVLLAGNSFVALAADEKVLPRFSEFSIATYHGSLKIPDEYRKINDGWRDDMGKLVAPVEINFAGRYYIGVHSCGAGCRYYSLSDLSNGSDSNALDMFSNADGHPRRVSDGREYTSNLVFRPGSRMLVAQYLIQQSTTFPDECRERIFVLSDDGKKIRPITGTIEYCENED
jgi:hypothetical protein